MFIIFLVVLLYSLIFGYKFIVSIMEVCLVRNKIGINLDILLEGNYLVVEDEWWVWM